MQHHRCLPSKFCPLPDSWLSLLRAALGKCSCKPDNLLLSPSNGTAKSKAGFISPARLFCTSLPADCLQRLRANVIVFSTPCTGRAASRVALQKVLESFDASQVSEELIWSLLSTSCADIAVVLSAHRDQVDPATTLAALAAAGQWDAALPRLLSDYDRSSYPPGPAPRGCALHIKLVAAAQGAAAHGCFSVAQQLLQRAGEWDMLLLFAVAPGDFKSLRNVAQMGSSNVEISQVGAVLPQKH